MSFARISGRWSAVRHKTMVRGFSSLAPYYLVNEFPKSGGTWLAQMLSEALEVPFRRNLPIRFERSVTHGHFLNPVGLRRVVVLWRDPRDVLVSFYYHCYFVNEHSNAALVQLMKAKCPFDDYYDIEANLPAFIRFLTDRPASPSFTWPEFAQIWVGRPGTIQTSYEALRADTSGELARVAEALVGRSLPAGRSVEVSKRHSFARVKLAAEQRRSPSTEMSFLREGALGGWRKHFSRAAEDSLQECGYHSAMRDLRYL